MSNNQKPSKSGKDVKLLINVFIYLFILNKKIKSKIKICYNLNKI